MANLTVRERARVLYGTEEPVAPARLLTAGPLSAELEAGNLRYIRFKGVELIRAIAFVVRSPTWTTYEPEIADIHIDESARAFEVSFNAAVHDGEKRLDYAARINGQADGRLVFACEATARTDFSTCRTGFVVLHPLDGVCGRAVEIEHTDGRIVVGRFPVLIDPVQPLMNLHALTHEPAPGLRVTCRMTGDVFEMEDHRNWTDASFKTYVRPLALPWPYTLDRDTTLRQSVSLTVSDSSTVVIAPDQAVEIELGDAIGHMPPIGLGCIPDEAEAAMAHPGPLQALGLQSLVCRFDPRLGHGVADLERYRDLADRLGAAAELQLVVASVDKYAEEIDAAAAAVRAARLPLAAIAVSPAPDLKSTPPGTPWPASAPLEGIYRAARAAFPGVRLGGGMFSYFTELNRKRPRRELLDFLTFATSAVVHAADDRSVMETLEALPYIAASVQAIAGDTPYVVGPSAIGMRDNPYGPGPLPNPGGARQAMSGRDPRQAGLINAAWTLGYIARFATAGAARIAVSAPVGDLGIVSDAGVAPVYHVLRACARLQGAELRRVQTMNEHDLLALHAAGRPHHELWLANLTDRMLRVVCPNAFTGASLCVFDAAAAAQHAGDPGAFDRLARGPVPREIMLDSYAVAVLVNQHASGGAPAGKA